MLRLIVVGTCLLSIVMMTSGGIARRQMIGYGVISEQDTVTIFISPTCPVCQQMTPYFDRLYTAYGDAVMFRILVPDGMADREEIDSFRVRYACRYRIGIDSGNVQVRRLDAHVTPEAFLHRGGSPSVLYRGRINDLYVALGRRRQKVRSHDLRDAIEAVVKGAVPVVDSTEPIGCIIER